MPIFGCRFFSDWTPVRDGGRQFALRMNVAACLTSVLPIYLYFSLPFFLSSPFSPLFSIPLFFYFFLPLFLGFWFFEDWELGLLFKVKILGEQRGAERRQGGIESCARSRFAFLLLDVFVFEFVWRCVIPSVCLRSLDGPACVFGFCRGMRVWKKLSKILSDRFFPFFFFFFKKMVFLKLFVLYRPVVLLLVFALM